MNPQRCYDYLMITRERLFDAVRLLTPEQYRQSFSFGLRGGIASTMTHLMVSEWYYIERLEGRDVPPYSNWPIDYDNPLAFNELEPAWREQGQRIRDVIARERDWTRVITWLSFPDDTRGNKRFHITCTAGDLITQLVLHEVHHRAQLMGMLRQLGHTIVEDIDFNALMYQRIEAET